MTDLNPLLKSLKGIRLSDNERLRLRERLAAYTDMHPAIAPDERVMRGVFSIFTARHFTAFAAAFFLVIATGSGITLAAGTSVPGDTLYSVKVNIAEPLQSALAPTAEGQAKVAADIATERVDEAVTLAARGQLTPERKAYLSAKFQSSVKVAAMKTDALAGSGDATGAENVKANLAAQLAGEAQALGAVTTNDLKDSSDLLQTIVATSQSIAESDGGSAVVAVNAVSLASVGQEQATTTGTSTTVMMHTAALARHAAIASSTAAVRENRFGKLHELGAFASTTLAVPTLTAPRTDEAIPSQPAFPSHATVVGGLHLDD